MLDEKKIEEAIQNIRPALQNDGGDIEFVEINGNIVFVRLTGACVGCAMSSMTLKHGVERYLKSTVDESIEVFNVE